MIPIPNHCSNQFTTTNQRIIAVLKDCAERGEDDFINALVPVPLELKNIITGSAKAPDGSIVRLWRRGPDDEVIPITETERLELVAMYQFDNWYDWGIANHGTKWGSYSTSYDFTDDEAFVTFDTAWSPPTPFLEKITRFYPQGRTQLAYAEGGMSFFGRDVYVDGEQVVEEFSDGEFYLEDVDWDTIDDPMDALTPSCRAHLETFGLHVGG